MLDRERKQEIAYEFPDRPESGKVMEVAQGVSWLRMPLPFALGHINLWLLEDGNGWTIVDTGVGTDDCKEVWQQTFTGAMDGRPVTRVLVTHLHPDHSGLAGWLTEMHDVELLMSREEYLLCRILAADTGRPAPEAGVRFYKAAGYSDKALDNYKKMFGTFGRFVSPLPQSYRRMIDGDVLTIGDRDWQVIVGRGHSPEHACLYCAELNVLISGDQILPTISSNISVHPTEPAANPLADWMTSLREFKDRLPEDVLVLPAHGKPFRSAHQRLDQLIHEHDKCLADLLQACTQPKRAIDVFPALFKSKVSGTNLMFATGESVAHLNYLLNTAQMSVSTDSDGVDWYQSRS
jgi:glyoxylase-like metal-dependent hydrolase (beta-lactamase superfamily II)